METTTKKKALWKNLDLRKMQFYYILGPRVNSKYLDYLSSRNVNFIHTDTHTHAYVNSKKSNNIRYNKTSFIPKKLPMPSSCKLNYHIFLAVKFNLRVDNL